MKKSIIFLLISLVCIFHSPLIFSINDEPIVSKKFLAEVSQSRKYLEEKMKAYMIPGLTISVAVDGEVVWSEGMGYADLENKVPVTKKTKFRIASISKPVTAAALGQLMHKGKLDLDDSIQTYVYYFPYKRWRMTVRQVAGHLAGIRHYRGNEVYSTVSYPTVRSGLSIFMYDPLEHEPGTEFLYSSYGWNLISAAVEGASGTDFLTYMKKNIFNPFGLNSFAADWPSKIIPNRARFYNCKEGYNKCILKNAEYVDNSYKWAGGGLLANSLDIVKFGLYHLDESLFPKEIFQKLVKPLKLNNGKSTNYGMGWETEIDANGYKHIGHSGGSIGGVSMFRIYPHKKVVISFACNRGNLNDHVVPIYEITDKVAKIFIK